MFLTARRRPVLLLTSVCAVLVVAGCGGAQARKQHHLEKGKAFLEAGNFEKARVEFRNALQIAPTDAEVRYDNGVVAEKLNNPREAAQFYQGAIDSNPDAVRARAGLGRLYLFAGAPDKALSTVAPSLAKHPEDVPLLTVRAGAEVQLKDISAAAVDAERAVALAPGDEDAVAVLAGIYRADNQTEKAQALLEKTIKANPSSVSLRLVLAQLDASLGQDSAVETLLLDLVKLKPEEKSHRLRLSQFYARTNHLDEAERVLRESVKELPQERDLKIALVSFLAARRSREAAEQELNTLIAADPKDFELRFAQAQFYEQGKDVAKAEAVYKDVIAAAKLEAAGISARDRLAALRVQQGDVPGAEQLIGEVLAASPRDDDALILRGDLALAHKDPRAAIADLRSVLRDQPNAVGVMRTLSRAHLQNGEPALAEETMRRALEVNPKDPATRLDFARLLAQLGKPEQAKPVIEQLVKEEPNDLQALDTEYRVEAAVKDFVTAKAAADAIVATQPKAAVGYYYQGQLAEADQRPEEAVKLYATALELQPGGIEPLEAITRTLVGLKRAPDALKRLDDAMVRDPASPLAANLKGEVLLSTGRAQDAIVAFREAVQRQPKWWTPYRNLAYSQASLHDTDGAVSTLRDGIAKVTAPDPLIAELGSLFERAGRIDEAIGVYESALKKNPNADIAKNNLAMLLVTYRKDPASLQRAKDLSAPFATSGNPNFLDTYGWVLYKRGEATAAVTALQTAAAETADSPVSLYHLGMAQALAGQPDAARESLTRSLKTGKNFSGMDEARATLDKLAKDAPARSGAPTS
jgi:tetratricopeptide (TPR) repeat protein